MNGNRGGAERGGRRLLSIGVPVLFLFFLFVPQRPIQFIALFLIFLVLGSKAYSECLLRRLRLVRRDPELRIFRHEWISVELWIENSGRLPAFLLVSADSPGGLSVFRNIKTLFTLGGRRRQLFRWEAYCADRGVFVLGPARLRGADPLGLFPFTLIFEETSRLFVYPAPAFAAVKAPGGIPLGNLLTADPFNEDASRPRSLRDYNPGDDSRRINWKATAKMAGLAAGAKTQGPLLVNEYELSLSYPLVIFLNIDPLEYSLKNRELYIERAIEAAAALCLMAARERQVLGLVVHASACAGTAEAAIVQSQLSPAAFALIPVLERLAALKPFEAGAGPREDGADSPASPAGNGRTGLRASVEGLLEKAKVLPFGTRLVYAGPELGEKDYLALATLRRLRLSLEFFVIDERDLGRNFAGGLVAKYQMKDSGYEIL